MYANQRSFAKRVSTWVTICRQFNEHGNSAFKRSFPAVTRTIKASEFWSFPDELEACVLLFNARTRLVGFNQIRSTYMRYSDENFVELLRITNVDEYMQLARTRWEKREDFGG